MNFNREEAIERIRELIEQKELSVIDRENCVRNFEGILYRKENEHNNNEIRSVNQDIVNLIRILERKPDKKMEMPVPRPIPEPIPDPGKKEKIEKDIAKFLLNCDKLIKALNEVQRSLILSTSVDLNLNEEIKDVDNHLKEIDGEAQKLKNEISDFIKLYHNADFSLSVDEIEKIVRNFKYRVKELKIKQIQKYDAKVNAVNEKINAFKAMTGLDEETKALINELELLEPCATKTVTWKSNKYLSKVNYDKLIETLAKIDAIEKRGVKGRTTNSYDEELDYVEKELNEIESKVVPGLSLDDANRLRENLQNLDNMLDDITTRIKGDKDANIDDYIARITALKERIVAIRKKIDEILKEKGDVNDYRLLEEKIFTVVKSIIHVQTTDVPMISDYNEEELASVIARLDGYEKELDEIEKEITEARNQGKLDDQQVQQLNERLGAARNLLNSTREEFKNPSRAKDGDTFGSLNGRIDALAAAIDKLEEYIDSLDKPIKDREARKKIDKEIERLENEVKTIRKYLEDYKDKEPEKYEEASKRLNEQEQRLAELSKKYRKKCPFLVKSVKSAKEFYKKHKKAVLIAAGLAAIALVHATLGPVIIPAIMHGNLMIGHAAPALRGVLGGINGVLGKAIHAQVIDNMWTLANGIRITPYCASASLLKGIAISGMGTAAIVGPLVVAVKNLINKMHKTELKEKIAKQTEEEKKKISERARDAKEKVKEKFKKHKKEKETSDSHMEEYMQELYKQYIESGLTLDEFCLQNGIPDEAKKFIMLLGNDKAGGRRGR